MRLLSIKNLVLIFGSLCSDKEIVFEARVSSESQVAKEKDYAKGTRDTRLEKKKNAYVEEEVERKTTGENGRCESIKLSPLSNRLDTNFSFYWSFLRPNCSCSAALWADWLGWAARCRCPRRTTAAPWLCRCRTVCNTHAALGPSSGGRVKGGMGTTLG